MVGNEVKNPASEVDVAELSFRLRGLLVGTAVGDALGLPAEELSRRRTKVGTVVEWRHRLIFGRGMISDDTEHTSSSLNACSVIPILQSVSLAG